jgi:hypothetical protein
VKTARNVAIILAIAAAIDLLPNGGRAANTISALIGVGFGVAVGLFAVRMYRDQQFTLNSLGDRNRAILYGAIGVAVVDITAQPRLYQSSAGKLAFFVILGLVGWALYSVWRAARSY